MQEGNTLIIVVLLVLQICGSESAQPIYPEQIHLSFGKTLHEMVVTWITFSDTKGSYVWYGEIPKKLTFLAEGSSKKFSDGRNSRTIRYVHKVVLQDLRPQTFYAYRCGSFYGVSVMSVFKTIPFGSNWSPRLIVYGDMGLEGAVAFPFITKQASDYSIDAIFHIGDIAYNMDSCDGRVGDQFMRMIEPVARSIPYMTTAGNHEQKHNFSFYKNIFSMPGDSSGYYYSFNMGPAHLVAISTEVYYFTKNGIEPIRNQYNWLQKDLKVGPGDHRGRIKKAAKIRNRSKHPWIIVFGHRPMYCSSDTGEDCSLHSSILRCACLNKNNYGLENLFHEFKVDLYLAGHMHYYERSWPIYNGRVFNGTYDAYFNPGAVVHIITGAAGMKCGTESASYIREDWFAFFSNEYSYTVLTIHNKTHVLLEQISATQGGRVIDSVWLIKDRI